ncbi:ketopantoate reductase family protein [Brevibacterium luteolum]|uniref:2-dehydropantoate 2-reductase n=1 Tax=Brevibacterium luteolum TaxID=199591 RepID=A0A2N6PHL8_9MICO|nr:2-dehydropantoate 2-reductase N-terminal domain-containing protein [Brevibacterium luteolum]PMB98171.1 2-dehydropantoate 2-reductase [Brevibacterium luteolum]
MNRYVIIGAGAIGGTLAAAGSDAGLSITVIARGEHADAIAAGGLAMRTPSGNITARPELARSPEEVELRTGDVLVLATKTNQALTALPQWADRPVTGASGTVIGTAGELLPIVLLLNGTEAARQAPRHFRTVVAATVWMPALFLSPGEVITRMQPDHGAYFAGPVTADPEAVATARQFVTDARTAGFAAEALGSADELWPHIWGKLLTNLANGLDSILGPGIEYGELNDALKAEAKAVYAAAGIDHVGSSPKAFDIEDRIELGEVAGVEEFASSSWQSLARGTGSIETDYLGGEIVRIGNTLGVPVGKNAFVMRWCRALAAGDDLAGQIPADPQERLAVLRRVILD